MILMSCSLQMCINFVYTVLIKKQHIFTIKLKIKSQVNKLVPGVSHQM